MKFGKSPVNSFWGEVFLKKKLTNEHMHALTLLSLYKSIMNRIIKKKIESINLIYQNFDVVIVCILTMTLHKAPIGSNSYCF